MRRTAHIVGALFALFFTNSALSAQGTECQITLAGVSQIGFGDTIRTGATGTTEIDLAGVGQMIVGPRSVLWVETSYCPVESGGAMRLWLVEGNLWVQGTSSDVKIEVATDNFLAFVGTSTLSIAARQLDTTFTIVQGTQEIATRDWKDTVETGSVAVPFAGPVSTIYALADRVVLMPWGARQGTILREGTQSTHGFTAELGTTDPKEINQSEVVFRADGGYVGL